MAAGVARAGSCTRALSLSLNRLICSITGLEGDGLTGGVARFPVSVEAYSLKFDSFFWNLWNFVAFTDNLKARLSGRMYQFVARATLFSSNVQCKPVYLAVHECWAISIYQTSITIFMAIGRDEYKLKFRIIYLVIPFFPSFPFLDILTSFSIFESILEGE